MILMHAYSRGQDFVAEKVTLDDAFEFLHAQSTEAEYDENFIGFTSEDDDKAMVQFIRHTDQDWTVDIPTFTGPNREYTGALNCKITKDLVHALTRDFFDYTNTFYNDIVKRDYDNVIEYCKVRYGIVFDLEVSD